MKTKHRIITGILGLCVVLFILAPLSVNGAYAFFGKAPAKKISDREKIWNLDKANIQSLKKLKKSEGIIKEQNETIRQLRINEASAKAERIENRGVVTEFEENKIIAANETNMLLEKRLRQSGDKIKGLNETIRQLKAKIEKLHIQLRNYKKLKTNYKDLGTLTDKEKGKNTGLQKQNYELLDRIVSLEATLSKDRASLYKELGTLYSQVKLYNQAIDAYEKSLAEKPDDPEVNYNIGILYKQCKNDPKKAVFHLKKFIELSPNAKNKKDAEYLIDLINNKT